MKVPPWNSSGFSLLSLALVAKSRTSAEMTQALAGRVKHNRRDQPRRRRHGHTNINLIVRYTGSAVPGRVRARTSRNARVTALITTSFTETLTPNSFMRCFRNLATPAKSASTEANACGTKALDSVKRLAMTLRIVVAGTSSKGAPLVGMVEGSKGTLGKGWKGSV